MTKARPTWSRGDRGRRTGPWWGWWALLGTLLLPGCPAGPSPEACGEDPCPPLTRCDEGAERCVGVDGLDGSLVSEYASLAVAPDGTVYVAGYAPSLRALAVGVWDREEARFRFTQVSRGGDVGRHASLGVFSDGRLGVLSMNAELSRLEFAVLNEAGVWQFEVVDETSSVGPDAAVYFDADDVVHVSYRDLTYGGLRYARRSGGVWFIEFVDTGDDLPGQIPAGEACPEEQRRAARRGVGFGSHLAVQDGVPVIAYYDADCGALRLARRSEDVWALRVLDGWRAEDYAGPSLFPATRVGRTSDLAVDPLGRLMVAYFDATSGELKVAENRAGVVTVEVADDGVRASPTGVPSKRFVGQMPSIGFDADGTPVITHLDAASRRVLLSTRVDDHWRTESLDDRLEGFFSDLAIGPGGTRHVLGLSRVRRDGLPISLVSVTP